MEDKVQFGFGGIIKGKKHTAVVMSASSRGLTRGKPSRGREDGEAAEDRRAGKFSQ